MHLNRIALSSVDAQQTARLILAGKPIPVDMSSHIEAANHILQAIEQKQFIMPAWHTGHYSRSQFDEMRQILARRPSISRALSTAEAAKRTALIAFPGPDFELFGARRSRLRCPVAMAKNAAYSCPRLPFEFKPKTLTAADFCDWVDDVENNCLKVTELSELLTTAGMLDPSADMLPKISALIGTPSAIYIEAIVQSVHAKYLSESELSCLHNVSHGWTPPEVFTQLLKSNADRRAQESGLYWSRIRMKIAQLAGVFSEVSSYSHAHLTKRLRAALGSRFQVSKMKSLDCTRYVVEIDEAMPLGYASHAYSPFELVNWVIALDAQLDGAIVSLDAYWMACRNADQAITRMRAEERVSG